MNIWQHLLAPNRLEGRNSHHRNEINKTGSKWHAADMCVLCVGRLWQILSWVAWEFLLLKHYKPSPSARFRELTVEGDVMSQIKQAVCLKEAIGITKVIKKPFWITCFNFHLQFLYLIHVKYKTWDFQNFLKHLYSRLVIHGWSRGDNICSESKGGVIDN